jgi:hypothetical protein
MASPPATRRQLREFGLLIGITFPVLFGWLLPSLKHHHLPSWPFLIGLPALVLALVAPRWLGWPYRGWMALGHGLGWINRHVILGAVFVRVVQPIALLMRLFGHDPLRRRRHGGESYRERRLPSHPIDLKRIF